MHLEIGQQAPDFTLKDSDKNDVHLGDFRGKNVVLLFFPAAFTGVCTKELCSMRDSMGDYEKLNAQVVATSVDAVFSLAKFKEEQGFNFPLLSDFNKVVCKKYGAFYDEWILNMHGVAKRAAFVIDKEGIIRHIEILESAGDMPDFKAVEAVLAKLN